MSLGTGKGGGARNGLCHERGKTQGPQWADSLLVGDRKPVGNGVCHSTKKSVTCRGVWGPVMVLCYCGDLGVRNQGRCQREEGMEFVLAKEKARAI